MIIHGTVCGHQVGKENNIDFWLGATIGIRIFHQKNLPLISDNF